MSGFVAYTFTDQQKVDIRRFCWYPFYGDGSVVFPYPWIMRQYLALEYRLLHLSTSEAGVITQYLTNLTMLESALPGSSATLNTESAAVWKRNPAELKERGALYRQWRMELCNILGVPPGPAFGGGGGNTLKMVV